MTAQKQVDLAAGKTTQPPGVRATARKPWKKKTAVEGFLDQIEKLRNQIAEKEEELKSLQRELAKFEQARKIFESA